MKSKEDDIATPENLKVFQPFKTLQAEQLMLLAKQVSIEYVNAEKIFVGLGEYPENDYFLINGTVSVTDKLSNQQIIESGTPRSLAPLAKIRPSLYSIKSITPVKLLVIPSEITDIALSESPHDHFKIDPHTKENQSATRQLFLDIYTDLRNNKLILPSLPDIAFKIRRSIDNGLDVREISRVINMDPVIAAKLIKISNSPLYKSQQNVETCSQAISRMGLNTTKEIVMSFAMNEVFKTNNKTLKKLMNDLWEHSIEVGAICLIFSKALKFLNPENAFLAGLVHDIGVIPILYYVEKYPDIFKEEISLQACIQSLRAEMGSVILKRWNFSESFCLAAQKADEWWHETQTPDYADLVIIAQIHSQILKGKTNCLPKFNEIPAFKQLGLHNKDPEFSINILNEAKEHIREIKNVFKSV